VARLTWNIPSTELPAAVVAMVADDAPTEKNVAFVDETASKTNIRFLKGVRTSPVSDFEAPLVVVMVPSNTVGSRFSATVASASAIAIGLSRKAIIIGDVMRLSTASDGLVMVVKVVIVSPYMIAIGTVRHQASRVRDETAVRLHCRG
jgi:hypothetical protein